MSLILKLAFLWILFQGFIFDNISGHPLTYNHDGFKDTCKCNYNCWPMIRDSVNGLEEQQILAFLKTLGHSCDNNAEFSEFSNEILFKIMELNSDSFISVIEKYQADIEFASILKMIEYPINDLVDLKKLLRLVNGVKSNSMTKNKIIHSLKIAINISD